jgi:hypothetical protein
MYNNINLYVYDLGTLVAKCPPDIVGTTLDVLKKQQNDLA